MSKADDTTDKPTPASVFDLAQFGQEFAAVQEAGIEVDITHPKTHARIGLKFLMAGPDSERYKAARNKARAARRERTVNAPMTPEEDEQEAIAILADSTINFAFDPGVTFGGKVMEFSPVNARRIFASRGLSFVLEQVDRKAGLRANFLKD